MLVAVKTETTTNTAWDTALVPGPVLRDLNREERLSDWQKKSCFNFSKAARMQSPTGIVIDTHKPVFLAAGKT